MMGMGWEESCWRRGEAQVQGSFDVATTWQSGNLGLLGQAPKMEAEAFQIGLGAGHWAAQRVTNLLSGLGSRVFVGGGSIPTLGSHAKTRVSFKGCPTTGKTLQRKRLVTSISEVLNPIWVLKVTGTKVRQSTTIFPRSCG